MASSSPSEFLTFMRRFGSSQALRKQTKATRSIAARSFSSSIQQRAEIGGRNAPGGKGSHETEKQHILDKDKQPNIQANASRQGRENRAEDTGGHATQQKDSTDSKDKIKKEFPEAASTIGFEDERGGKGV